MVAAEGNGFFEAKNTACSEYYPSFQVNPNKVFFLLLRTYILMTLTFRVTVHQFFCTKIAPFPWRIGKQSMINCFQASKDRMNKPVDMLQLHWPPSLGWQESNYLDAFSDIIQSKDAIQVGMSNFGPNGLRRVDQIMKDKGIKIHSNQVSVMNTIFLAFEFCELTDIFVH